MNLRLKKTLNLLTKGLFLGLFMASVAILPQEAHAGMGAMLADGKAQIIIKFIAGIMAIIIIVKALSKLFSDNDASGLLLQAVMAAALVAIAVSPTLLTTMFSAL
jgi:hypothetical protein